MTKTCTSCLGRLDASSFQKNSIQADGLKTICKRCVSWREIHNRLNRSQEEKDRVNIRRREWRLKNPTQAQKRDRAEWLRRVEKRNIERPGEPVVKNVRIRHKISEEVFWETKNSPCRICGAYDDIVIDHDHQCCKRFACENCSEAVCARTVIRVWVTSKTILG